MVRFVSEPTFVQAYNPRRRIMGFDVGKKYVGVSISDSKNFMALPLDVLQRDSVKKTKLDKKLRKHIESYDPQILAVGIPYEYPKTRIMIEEFIRDLWRKSHIEIPAVRVDEQHSTTEAYEFFEEYRDRSHERKRQAIVR
eukprot:gb/GECH01009124.1/.p1 GENE.gb/GECH01009124.1/~~gb/GECH01009124.1/.p1  ORF type:complete len:140 (+),score=23.53 gb/GECH01009124.1/:1-420(+)